VTTASRSLLLDASADGRTVITLTGGGLTTVRTLSTEDELWAARDTAVRQRADRLQATQSSAREWRFWSVVLPLILFLYAGLALAVATLRPESKHRVSQTTPRKESA
jgi:high-affinity iron transporter